MPCVPSDSRTVAPRLTYACVSNNSRALALDPDPVKSNLMTFRDDLYYRLNVFPIHLPPLRERPTDIPLLVEHCVTSAAAELGWPKPQVSPEALSLLGAYRWPGNVRELRNIIERAVLLCDGGEIAPAHLPKELTGAAEAPLGDGEASSLEGYEKAMILKALRENNWNQ